MWKALDYADVARFCNSYGAHATTIDACRIGLSLDPDNAMLYVYRACAYDEFGRLPEAVADCEAAIRLDPRGPGAVLALITLALVRERQGDSPAALEAAHAAIAIEPADREAHAVLGTLRAWHGDYPAAWPELECHWIDERMQFRQRFPDLAEWNGEAIDGRRLLLVHGQGLGDLLQMLRYVPRLRAAGRVSAVDARPRARGPRYRCGLRHRNDTARPLRCVRAHDDAGAALR
jgi:tetratricopeptide (TPR) repeat protein